MTQLQFGDGGAGRPVQIGHASVEYRPTQSILTRATGFMADYDYTLNPYAGCSFGCSYCYAAFFSRSPERRDTWGYWVDVKENALNVFRRMRTPLRDKTIYMSSVTDPYQPIERKLELVRGLLEELVRHQPRLVVQTRSQLVTRDIDLLSQLDHVQVNMTVTTDSERVRRAFEPHCSTNRKRLDAIAAVERSGIECAITMTPLLPVEDAAVFASDLVATGVERFVVQPFHADRGRFVAGTREQALTLVREMGWTPARYRQTVDILRSRLPHLAEGREGFAPA
jgi:DNA repair photolyase